MEDLYLISIVALSWFAFGMAVCNLIKNRWK